MENNSDDKTRSHLALNEGAMVSHYRIESKIGAGGMGEVFLAEDTKLKRKVALKFLPSHLVANETVRTRFIREAQILARLNHPNIVSIYEVSDYEGRPFYAMELVEGESLHHFVHKKPLPIDMIIEYALQICQGLGEAHRAGIIHRDIKAANIAVDKNNRIRLLDFGLAAGEDEEKITKTGSTLGTVAYMSPEQASGRGLDHRSDLFSLGVVLYELIAGRTPFKRDSEAATIKAIMSDNPEPLSRYKTDVPEKLQQIISELLEKDKEIRYQSAEGVVADLKRLLYDSQPSSAATGFVETKPRSKTGLYTSVAVVAIAIIAAIAFFINQDKDATEKKESTSLPMIAVLPFENLGAADDEYFADGMTDEITSRLAGIVGLGVISRTSSMKYKATDKGLKEIGAELGVEYILEGTVRWNKGGDQPKVRITPQLIEVANDRHLWADNYERAMMDVFDVQADIAAKIVGQLGMTLVKSGKAGLDEIPTRNSEAYQQYLRGLSLFHSKKKNDECREALDSAVILDPKFALAFALRSRAYSSVVWHQPHTEKAKIGLESAQKSLELQPGLAQGHLALGFYYHWVETDYGKSMEQFSIAEAELPNDPELLTDIAFVYARQANIGKSIEYERRATNLDPLNTTHYRGLCGSLKNARRYDEALQVIDRAIALEADKDDLYVTKIRLYKSWYGVADSLMPIAVEALKHCDTMEFAKRMWDDSRYLPLLPWDSLAAKYAEEIYSKDTVRYDDLYRLYDDLGNRDLAIAYADSSLEFYRTVYESTLDNPYSHSSYGLVLSTLGECEKAVEIGLKGKEMLSYDDCFM